MNKKAQVLMWVILITLLLLSFYNLFLLIDNRKSFTPINHSDIKKIVQDELDKIEPLVIEKQTVNGIDGQNGEQGEPGLKGDTGERGADGYTPVKGVDYFDGEDAKTPFLRCNLLKNRWEVAYGIHENFTLLNGEVVKCTPSL